MAAENLFSTSSRAALPSFFRIGVSCAMRVIAVADRHGQRRLSLNGDLPAAGRVGGDHGTAAGCRLKEAFRQALTARREHSKMGATPHLADVIHVAEPFDLGLA